MVWFVVGLCWLGAIGSVTSRVSVSVLSVPNQGGYFGDWGHIDYCPDGQFAYGFRTKVEPDQGSGDDTGLNGIQLMCASPDSERTDYDYRVLSSVGHLGSWSMWQFCEKNEFLTGFDLRVELFQGRKWDDAAATDIKFWCRKMVSNDDGYYKNTENGSVEGHFTGQPSHCFKDAAICSIQTRIEEHQGDGDDTGLNDVTFNCCSLSNGGSPVG